MSEVEVNFPVRKVENSRLDQTDFEHLKFGKEFSDHMFYAEYLEGKWQSAEIKPYEPIPYSPAASVFHYGQAIFEGLKAYKTNDGKVLLFRPEANRKRFEGSAERMCMPKVPREYFIEGIKELIRTDINWVPDNEDQSLYIRPFMIATESFLGVKPSDHYQFMIITSPTSAYYSGAVKVKIETEYTRAAEGGIGAAKAAANYAASLLPAQIAKKQGYDQLIWTDSKTHQYIEESGTMNLMMIKDQTLITPPLKSLTILPGITRDSILKLADHWGMQVEERRILVDELVEGLKENAIEELFGVGTAATIAPIAQVGHQGTNYELTDSSGWEFANRAKSYLEKLKRGEIDDQFGWTMEV